MQTGTKVQMVCCVGREPETIPLPVQTHVGHEGIVLWEDSDGVVVRFADGDERKLFREEIKEAN